MKKALYLIAAVMELALAVILQIPRTVGYQIHFNRNSK